MKKARSAKKSARREKKARGAKKRRETRRLDYLGPNQENQS